MLIDELENKELVLKVNYGEYKEGEACFISSKGNICLTDHDGKVLFTKNQLDRNPDLLDIFFYTHAKNPFNTSEKAFIKSIVDNFTFPLTAKFSVEKTRIFFDIEYKFVNITDRCGRLLLKMYVNNAELFKDNQLSDYEHTIAELGNLVY